MTDVVSFYSDARRYDLTFGAYATGGFLDFYQRQIARYGEPVLELACGSGRLTIPLAEEGVNITGLDISLEMLNLARLKASERGTDIRFIHGDMCNFELGEKFKFIFIPAQSLSHVYNLEGIENCFSRVRQHLMEGGKFLIELFNTSVKLLARDSNRRYPIGEYEDPNGDGRVFITEQSNYDAATQVNHNQWFFRIEGNEDETLLSFKTRQYFPQEIDALLWYNRFLIEHKYGSYSEEDFSSDAKKQLIICSAI